MITTEVFANRIEVRAFGEVTLADYKVFEELANYRIRFNGPIDLLLDFRDAAGVTLDVAVEEFRFSRVHKHDFGRVAFITEDQWLTWGAFISQFFSKADVRVFDSEEEARTWLGEPEPGFAAPPEDTAQPASRG
jgi:hypothetical protein